MKISLSFDSIVWQIDNDFHIRLMKMKTYLKNKKYKYD